METKYKLEDLEKAVQKVKNKTLSLGKAATVYDVPKSTIHDYLNKDIEKMPQTGRKAIFTEEQEKELEEYILKCSKLFYGLTIEMKRKIAFKFAEVNKLKHNFNKTTAMAGKDWFYGFIKRHPNISLRKPEATSMNRITAFNQNEVKIFFDNLENLQKKYQFNANRIYNVDESGISNVQRNSKILAPKGQKQVGMATSGDRGTTTTVVCAFSASGKYVPPFFIFKRKRMNAQLLRGGNADMVAAVSDSGWITESLFIDWLHHFISYAKPVVEEPTLLVLDNHENHVSLGCYLLCRQNGIVLLSLPPHTSHRMQPLDLIFFGPLKTAYNKECDLYMASNVLRRISQFEVVELFTKAFNRISNIQKAANGFRAAGIWPLDTNKFDEMFSDLESSNTQIESLASLPSLQKAVTLDSQIEQRQFVPVSASPLFKTSTPLKNSISIPQLPQANNMRNSKKRHSIIITSSPMKDFLEEKEEKKKKKVEQKKNVKIENTNKIKKVINLKAEQKKLKKEQNKTDSINKRKRSVKNLKGFEDDDVLCKKKKSTKKVTKDEDEYYCLICNEKYEIPITEDWIICYKCKRWAHENCTSGESTSRGFICDFCAN